MCVCVCEREREREREREKSTRGKFKSMGMAKRLADQGNSMFYGESLGQVDLRNSCIGTSLFFFSRPLIILWF